jgi:hypothetical protein
MSENTATAILTVTTETLTSLPTESNILITNSNWDDTEEYPEEYPDFEQKWYEWYTINDSLSSAQWYKKWKGKSIWYFDHPEYCDGSEFSYILDEFGFPKMLVPLDDLLKRYPEFNKSLEKVKNSYKFRKFMNSDDEDYSSSEIIFGALRELRKIYQIDITSEGDDIDKYSKNYYLMIFEMYDNLKSCIK